MDEDQQLQSKVQANWRDFPLTILKTFGTRNVASLTVAELKDLRANWMACVVQSKRTLSAGEAALYVALREALSSNGLDCPPLPVQQKPEPTSSPQRQKFVIPPLPRQSEAAEQTEELSEPAKEEEFLESGSEESESFGRRPLEEIISDFGISGVHPAADLVPMSTDEEFQIGCHDVKVHGFLHAVKVTDENLLLDGRNRLQIASAISLDPPIERFNPSDPIAYVLSENVVRRHLTLGQRAMIGERLSRLPRGRPRNKSEELQNFRRSESQAEVAGKLDITPKAITMARTIRQWAAPEEVQAVEAGAKALHRAYERAQEKKHDAEGKPPPKRKKQSKQKKDPPADDMASSTAPEPTTLEQRAKILFSWMQQVHEKPIEYDGAKFADLAQESVGENLEAVAEFYRAFFARFRERFPAQS
jgi:hypothetical protein